MQDNKKGKHYLYRIMSDKRVRELFDDGCLVFLKPESWRDPFENYLSKVFFVDDEGTIHHIEYFKRVYGQCYSLGTETSLMWDAYTPKGDGVRIKIDKHKLIKYLRHQNQLPGKDFTCGKVEYKRYGDFISRLKKDDKLVQLYKRQDKMLMKYFFEKRYEYRDEREFRIMYDANSNSSKYGNYLRINIPVIELIESVRFDPKMSESECGKLKEYFKSKGMNGKKIHRSLLYKYEVKRNVKIK